MKPRLDPFAAAPKAMQAMVALETYLRGSGLERSTYHLVQTRAFQINGCAYCVHIHTRDARAAGESEERLYLLAAGVLSAQHLAFGLSSRALQQVRTPIAGAVFPAG